MAHSVVGEELCGSTSDSSDACAGQVTSSGAGVFVLWVALVSPDVFWIKGGELSSNATDSGVACIFLPEKNKQIF